MFTLFVYICVSTSISIPCNLPMFTGILHMRIRGMFTALYIIIIILLFII